MLSRWQSRGYRSVEFMAAFVKFFRKAGPWAKKMGCISANALSYPWLPTVKIKCMKISQPDGIKMEITVSSNAGLTCKFYLI